VTPRLLILAAALKSLLAVDQAAEPKSLLQHAIHVPATLALESVVERLVAVCSENVVLAAAPKSPELAIHVQETTAELQVQAAALKPALVVRLLFAALQFWMVSRA